MHLFTEILHTLPLFLIALLLVAPIAWKLLRKQNLVIQQLDSLLLMLSAIGVAAGANVHDHGPSMIFDPCFGYAAVMICVAARLLGMFKKHNVLAKA